MSDDTEPPPFEYLLDCSKTSLHSFIASRLNKSANLRKELLAVLNEWIEARALAMLGEWFDMHGEKLMELAAQPRGQIMLWETKDDALPVAPPKKQYDFWRVDGRRFNSRRRAG